MATVFSRNNNASRAEVQTSVIFAQGAFKNVYKGTYTVGERKGEECVCKIFKSGSVFEDSYFKNELKVVDKALEIINEFNRDRLINQNIWLNMPTVWTVTEESYRAGEKSLIEPMIPNFEKFNSNTGWTPDKTSHWIDVMQALSHYSYHVTDRRLLFCDLQGGVCENGFIITDPVIMSTTKEYGPTDLGPKGISTFFAKHKCNKFCNRHWAAPLDKKVYFKVQKGSSMILSPQAGNGTSLSRHAGIGGSARVDSGYVSMNQIPEE